MLNASWPKLLRRRLLFRLNRAFRTHDLGKTKRGSRQWVRKGSHLSKIMRSIELECKRMRAPLERSAARRSLGSDARERGDLAVAFVNNLCQAHRSAPLGKSKAGDINDRLGEGLRGFLRQIVPNAAGDEAVVIFPREPRAVRRLGRMRRTVRVAFHGNRGHSDRGKCGQPLFQVIILSLAIGLAKPGAR